MDRLRYIPNTENKRPPWIRAITAVTGLCLVTACSSAETLDENDSRPTPTSIEQQSPHLRVGPYVSEKIVPTKPTIPPSPPEDPITWVSPQRPETQHCSDAIWEQFGESLRDWGLAKGGEKVQVATVCHIPEQPYASTSDGEPIYGSSAGTGEVVVVSEEGCHIKLGFAVSGAGVYEKHVMKVDKEGTGAEYGEQPGVLGDMNWKAIARAALDSSAASAFRKCAPELSAEVS